MKISKPFNLGPMTTLTAYLGKGFIQLMDAVKSSATLKTIRFSSRPDCHEGNIDIDVLALESIYDSLATNTSVTEVEIYIQHPAIFEILKRVLQVNNRISTVNITMNHLTQQLSVVNLSDSIKTASGLVNLCLCNATLDSQKWKFLSRGIKRSQWLKHVELQFGNFNETSLKQICLAIKKNSSISSVLLNQISMQEGSYKPLAYLIRNNTTLKSLEIRGVNINSLDLLGESLKRNRTLEKLTIRGCKLDHVRGTGFDSNKAAKILLSPNLAIRPRVNTEELTIKRHAFSSFCASLKQNRSITELDLAQNTFSEQSLDSVSEVISQNKSIRTLRLSINRTNRAGWHSIVDALTSNDTLTRLDFSGSQLVPGAKNALMALLKENRSINSILNMESIIGVDFHEVADAVKKNEIEQIQNKQNTIALLNMISRRQEEFFAIFPLEIWLMITENINFPGVSFDFSRQFVSFLNNKSTATMD